jgi:hypothetical protein
LRWPQVVTTVKRTTEKKIQWILGIWEGSRLDLQPELQPGARKGARERKGKRVEKQITSSQDIRLKPLKKTLFATLKRKREGCSATAGKDDQNMKGGDIP